MTIDTPTRTEIVYAGASLRERQDYAIALSKAGALVPKGFREANGDASPGKILLAAEYGNMVGVHPVAALNGINVIEGKPTPSPALMSALVRKAGHKLRVTVQGAGQDLAATATLVRRDDPDYPFTVTWTLAKAKRAGLEQKDVWKKYPEAMLKARAISEVCREGAEDVLLGMTYTAEELGADVNEDGEVIEYAEVVETPAPAAANQNRTKASKTPTTEDEPEVVEAFEPAPWEDRLAYAGTSNELHKLWLDAGRAGVLDEALSDGQPFRDTILGKKARLDQDAAAEPAADSVTAPTPEYADSLPF